MSGATWGGIVGGIVGSFFGAPQLGWMIGSAIGGYVDPEVITGPRLKDARTQTSRDGVAIPFGWGVFPCAGNIIWQQSDVTEHRHEDQQGKGGPVVESFTYTRSYAIGICRGPIDGLLQVKKNGRLVFDARSDATLQAEYEAGGMSASEATARVAEQRAENAKFLSYFTLYLGDEAQTPDPTIEAHLGVGEVPAYRGLAYAVATDDDVTESQGAIPQYEFVVAVCGVAGQSAAGGLWYALPTATGSGDPNYQIIRQSPSAADWSLDPVAHGGGQNFSHIAISGQQILLTLAGSTAVSYSANRGATWTAGTRATATASGTSARAIKELGFWWVSNGPSEPISRSADGLSYTEPSATTEAEIYDLCRIGSRLIGTTTYNNPGTVSISDDVGETWEWVPTAGAGTNQTPTIATDGDVVVIATHKSATSKLELLYSQDRGDTWTQATSPFPTTVNTGTAIHYCTTSTPRVFVAGDSEGNIARSTDGMNWSLVSTPLTTSDKVWNFTSGAARIVAASDGKFVYSDDAGLTWTLVTPNDAPDSFMDVAFIGAAAVQIPDSPGFFVDWQGEVYGPSQETVEACETPLSEIVAELLEMSGLTADEYDVSDLEDIMVAGFRIANEGDAASAIAALMPSYFFDVGEWDGKVRFVLRGGTSVFAINDDDLVERDGSPFERERVQEAELLRRVTVGYIDPAAGYSPATQKWERRAGTVQAKGEASVELPLTLAADTAATIAKKRGLTAWGEPEKQKCSLPYRLAALTPTDVGTYTDADGEVYTLRIMQAEDDGGIRYIEASANSAEAYGATATGVAPKPPTVRPGQLLGPTQLVVMDLPIWRTTDADEVGVYVACAGALGGWRGARIDVSVDGGTSYVLAGDVTDAATIGHTTTAMAGWDSPEAPEETSVTVYLPRAPQSVDYETLLRYNNRAAIRLDSGAWAVIQYQTVTALGDNLYTLSGLILGRYATETGPAAVEATFVLLDAAVQFVRIERDYMGQSLILRPTSYGTSTDATETQEYEVSASPASQTEWPVHSVEATRDGSDNVTVTWVGRGRLGTETSPYHSVHCTGYRVTYSDGETYDVGTTTTTHTRSSAPVSQTITVCALNDITGEGPQSAGITV